MLHAVLSVPVSVHFCADAVFNDLRSTFALAAQPMTIALAPLCHGHVIRNTMKGYELSCGIPSLTPGNDILQQIKTRAAGGG